jgi:hypothetical protein
MKISKLLVLVSTVLAATAAWADPINLKVTFTVSTIDFNGLAASDFANVPVAGSQYFAHIVIDDAILSSDGIDKAAKVLGFTAQIGDSVWNPALPVTQLTDFMPSGASVPNTSASTSLAAKSPIFMAASMAPPMSPSSIFIRARIHSARSPCSA